VRKSEKEQRRRRDSFRRNAEAHTQRRRRLLCSSHVPPGWRAQRRGSTRDRRISRGDRNATNWIVNSLCPPDDWIRGLAIVRPAAIVRSLSFRRTRRGASCARSKRSRGPRATRLIRGRDDRRADSRERDRPTRLAPAAAFVAKQRRAPDARVDKSDRQLTRLILRTASPVNRRNVAKAQARRDNR
jgi:hypothetical protein